MEFKQGNVLTISLIDKGSVMVSIFLDWLILREAITPRLLLGAGFIAVGLLVIARK